MNLRTYNLMCELLRKIDACLLEVHGEVHAQARRDVAEMLRENSRDAATNAAGSQSLDEDYGGDFGAHDRDRARVYRAIADVLDPRDEPDEVAAVLWELGSSSSDGSLFRDVFGADHEEIHEAVFGIGLRYLHRIGLLIQDAEDPRAYAYSPVGRRVLLHGLKLVKSGG